MTGIGATIGCRNGSNAVAWRASHEPGWRPRQTDRLAVWSVRGLLPLGALTIFAGTAATAAGPHAGGRPHERIHRLHFYGNDTLNWVVHQHGTVAAPVEQLDAERLFELAHGVSDR